MTAAVKISMPGPQELTRAPPPLDHLNHDTNIFWISENSVSKLIMGADV